MNYQRKEIKERINLFFGNIKHHIRVYTYNGKTLIDIEYEDNDKNEDYITEEVRKIIGKNPYLNVKRIFTDYIISKVHERYGNNLSQLDLCMLVSSYKP